MRPPFSEPEPRGILRTLSTSDRIPATAMNFRSLSLRVLLVAALGVSLAASAADAPKPKDAAAAPQSGAVDMQKAKQLVLELPEVAAWQESRREAAKTRTDGKPTGGTLIGGRDLKGVKHWAVTFYEDPQTVAKVWAVFFVRAKDGKIFVQGQDGGTVTLEDWRKTRPAV